jgi:hypothetical protein
VSDDKSGTEPSEDGAEPDASDWLASQFDPTERIPQQPTAPANPDVPPAPGAPRQDALRPVASPPGAAQQGGFSWGLRPSSAEPDSAEPKAPPLPPAAPTPPAAPPAVSPPPLVEPAAPMPAAPISAAPSPAVPTPAAPSAAAPTPSTPPAAEETPTEQMTQPLAWDDLPHAAEPTPPAVTTSTPTVAFAADPVRALPLAPNPVAPTAVPPAAATPGVFPPFGAPATAPPPMPPPPMPPTAGFPAPASPTTPTSALDALFGENQFQEYEPVAPSALAPATVTYGAQPAPPVLVEHAPLSRGQKVLIIVAGGLLAVLALVALFFLGERLGSASANPSDSSSAASTAVPTQAPSTGLASPGVHPYTALMGGECLKPFTSAWATNYTVVDCSAQHTAQLIFKGTLPDSSSASYPDGASFKSEITPLCSAPTALNYTAAKAITDLQVSFSYPPTAADWASGDRTYYCFVSRSASGVLTGSLAGTQK